MKLYKYKFISPPPIFVTSGKQKLQMQLFISPPETTNETIFISPLPILLTSCLEQAETTNAIDKRCHAKLASLIIMTKIMINVTMRKLMALHHWPICPHLGWTTQWPICHYGRALAIGQFRWETRQNNDQSTVAWCDIMMETMIFKVIQVVLYQDLGWNKER